MLSLSLVGQTEVRAALDAAPDAVIAALRQKIRALVIRLQAHIQRDKLSGQVLNVVTGALRRSITNLVTEAGRTIIGEVFSSGDVKYAAIHEFGGQTKAHIIEPRKAEALAFMMGGSMVFAKRVNHPGSRMPERSFMRSGLADMAPEIEVELKEATIQGFLQAGLQA